jgi:hypothetical protein
VYSEPRIKIYALEEVEGFAKGMSDEEWLGKISTWQPKPIALCGDGRILQRPSQLAALKNAKVHFVYLTEGWANLGWNELAVKGLKSWDDICAKTRKEREPTIFMVRTKNCDVVVLRKVADHQCHSEKSQQNHAARNQSA